MSAQRYTRTAMVLHWLVAVLVIANLSYTWFISSLPDSAVRPAIDLHKSFGLTVLGLVLLRILWRLSHRPPPLPDSMPALERGGAHLAHALLYVLILALPITGWIHDSAFKFAAQHPLTLFWTIPWFRIAAIADLPPAQKEAVHAFWFSVHVWLSYVLIALLALHLLGVIKHQVFDRNPVLGRMLPARRNS
ncbi:cytochrome b/b6 domain-containing protein [Acetobacteraceae bacterium KSS8]|uniref:Cytochrome b/b6 domain-containing protein n=1 Tax=Endosaccharibacter trunci TaxID=2812733 RepID=A0ABT1W3U7_9PROT|nr:cytochrome b/b6 domain-containing protein [Acetobacteraceae bacterium KSS8]